MENLTQSLKVIILFIILGTIISVSVYLIMDAIDTPKWKEERNKHRIYDPIDLRKEDTHDDDSRFISNK